MSEFELFDYAEPWPEPSDEVRDYEEEQMELATLGDLRLVAFMNLRQYEQSGRFIPRHIGLEAWHLAIQQERMQRRISELDEALKI